MGKKVGDYMLGATLGTGAYSKVKKGVHVVTKKVFAVKIIDAKKYRTKEKEEWMKREVAVLRKLDHPNIMKLEEVVQAGDKMHLVLEYVSGGELLEVIAKVKRLMEDEARYYFHQLLDAVAYMHGQSIVHRDLKPENILVTEKRVLKIADFGLSNVVEKKRGPGGGFHLMSTIVGSPDYCAPEVVQEKNYDGFKADIYSCGTVLYTMVTGTRPFEAKDDEATLQKVREGIFIVPRHISKECDSLIHATMEMDPVKRLDAHGVMRHPWFKVGWDDKNTTRLESARKVRDELTPEEVEGAISMVEVDKATGNAFSLIAGLQAGAVDALVGQQNDVRFLLTVPDMQAAFVRVVGLLKNMNCKVQERKGGAEGAATGRLLLFAYVPLAGGVMTFTAELQARPPGLVALTIRLERGPAKEFEGFCRVVSLHLCDLCEKHDWEMTKGSHPPLSSEHVLSPVKEAPEMPVGPTIDVGPTDSSSSSFKLVSTGSSLTVSSNKIYDVLLSLDANPLLLGNRRTSMPRIVGYITPRGSLLAFNVDFTNTGPAEFSLAFGSTAMFEELRTAVQSGLT